ncbi:MAG: ISKra4 family transposase [Ktedonobacterales bacterium]|nr:ISKra4 family transposase [Ktedonobacterales bacterium]
MLPAEAGFSPLDEELALISGAESATLREGMVRLAAWMPFARAAEQLAFFWGVTVSEATVRRQSEAAGAAYVAVQTATVERLMREQPPAPPGPACQQVSADGAMVPLLGGVWAEVKTVAIGTVHRGAGANRSEDHSYFSRLADHTTFTHAALCETHRRGMATAAVVVGVMDGSAWLQGFLDYHRPDAVRILDFPHAVQQISAVGQAVWGAGSAAATAWLDRQCQTLKHGDPDDVLAALRAVPVDAAVAPAAAVATRDATLGYLVSRRAQIAYADFQAAGYPIGSGIVESANKLVVEARLKGSGMHWAQGNVNGMLGLRTIACTDRWQEAWPQIVAQQRATMARHRVTQHARRRSAMAPPPNVLRATTARRTPRTTAVPQLPPQRVTTPHPWRRYASSAKL